MATRALGVLAIIVLTTLLEVRIAQAGPYVAPGGAPPVSSPLPEQAMQSLMPCFANPASCIGTPFIPPPVVNASVPTPVSSLWEMDICRFGQGQWVVNDPAVIQDLIGVDLL